MKIWVLDFYPRTTDRFDHLGFFHGAHGVAPEAALAEIQAKYTRTRHEIEERSIRMQKRLEVKVEHLGSILPHAQAQWERIRALAEENVPQFVLPLIWALLGVLALVGDVILLAPAMDLANVADRTLQYFTALGVAALAAGIFHIAWETFSGEEPSSIRRWLTRTVASATAFALVLFGILRGYQVAFSAELAGSPLGQFLRQHPFLAAVFFILLSLGSPIMAAGAMSLGVEKLRFWYQYRTSGRRATKLSRELLVARAELESETKGLERQVRATEERAKEAAKGYLHHHERGRRHGAEQGPYSHVHIKAAVSAVLTLLLEPWLLLLSLFCLLLPVAVYWIAFLYFRHQWKHPSPADFFAHEAVQFGKPHLGQELIAASAIAALPAPQVKKPRPNGSHVEVPNAD